MMGHSHALSGALGWLAAAEVTALAGHPAGIPVVVAGAATTAGAALLPDLDCPSGTAARFFGWPSEMLARLTAKVFRGHRHGTHTIWFALGAGVALWLCQQFALRYVLWVVTAILVGLALRGLAITLPGGGKHASGLVIMAEATGITWMVNQHVHTWLWLSLSVAGGCVVHLVGDSLTREGTRPFAPLTRRRVCLAVIRRTGNWLEHWVAAPLMILSIVGLAWILVGRHLLEATHG